MKWVVFVVCIITMCVGGNAVVPDTPGFSVSSVKSSTLISSYNSSSLYSLTLDQDDYQYPIYLVDLWGDRYSMGYAYGYLLQKQIKANYDAVMKSIVQEAGVGILLQKLLEDILAGFLDWQWNDYLSVQLPSEYNVELQGIQQGGIDAGDNDVILYITRALVLANVPSDIIDLRFILRQELEEWLSHRPIPSLSLEAVNLSDLYESILSRIFSTPRGLQCSMFAVWGERTKLSELYSARNLDYMPDMGINKYKLITVWHPNDGAYEHLSVGYAGMYGALTGVSAMGISVAEANLEVDVETFLGFPWLLRLRYIMENSLHLSEAWTLWENTNNTVGYNHQIASAYDAYLYDDYAAVALETMAGYTAYFMADDPREKFATYYDKYTNKNVSIGYPLPNALWRTNHGYDPTIREHYMWAGMGAGNWSMERYMFAYQSFIYYEDNEIPISYIEAINITSILGDKGPQAYHCKDNNYADGSNIVSVTYHPIAQQMYAAWENGEGSSWTPAACATYAHVDLTQWFTTSPFA